jgi:uncharacterized protein YecE (DUF72 family)
MKPKRDIQVCIGCAKWNRSDLKGFYPRGTKDELTYYSLKLNSVELNATFYSIPDWMSGWNDWPVGLRTALKTCTFLFTRTLKRSRHCWPVISLKS